MGLRTTWWPPRLGPRGQACPPQANGAPLALVRVGVQDDLLRTQPDLCQVTGTLQVQAGE
eukprot:381858-Rhodomonas_salina.1